MFVVRIVCLSLCACLVLYAFVRHRLDIEAYNEVEVKEADDMEQKIKAFYEPTELYGKHVMTDNNVVTYERVLKGMSREASDMAQSVTGDATNRVKESEANAQLIQQTKTEVAIQSQDTTINGASG